jgi:hypothetical protein
MIEVDELNEIDLDNFWKSTNIILVNFNCYINYW